MFETVQQIGDQLAEFVATLEPDCVPVELAGTLWGAFDRVERLAAAGKTLLARRATQAHRPAHSGPRRQWKHSPVAAGRR
jgi:hypothetical protein